MLSARFGLSFNNFSCTFVWQNWFFLAVLLPSVAAQVRLEQKQQERINKCARKVIEELNKSQYFQFADSTFCKTTDDIHQKLFSLLTLFLEIGQRMDFWFDSIGYESIYAKNFSILISRHVDRLPTRGNENEKFKNLFILAAGTRSFWSFFRVFAALGGWEWFKVFKLVQSGNPVPAFFLAHLSPFEKWVFLLRI